MITTLTGFCMMITLTFNELNMEKAVRKKLKIINLFKRCVKLHWVLDKSNLVYANSSCKIYLEEVQVQKNSFEPFHECCNTVLMKLFHNDSSKLLSF